MSFTQNNLNKNKYLFSGKEFQDGQLGGGMLGLYDFGSRYYNPVLGRWFCQDPALQMMSPYGYCGNDPVNYVDPDGEWIHIAIGALIGGAINLATHWDQVDSFGDGVAAFGIGAGALGAATGGAAFSAMGGVVAGGGGFLSGMVGGAVGSAVTMPVQSVGNSVYFGDPLMTPGEYLTGVTVGAVFGGAVNGTIAAIKGNNFWNGQLRSSSIPKPKLLPTRIEVEMPKAELAGQPAKSLVSDIPSSQTLAPLERQAVASAVEKGIPFNAELGGVNAAKGAGKELYNFGATAAKHMSESGRRIPLQILDEVLKTTKGLPDPEGSRALMYSSPMWRNGKLYNLEILYDKTSNSIWHFQYSPIK